MACLCYNIARMFTWDPSVKRLVRKILDSFVSMGFQVVIVLASKIRQILIIFSSLMNFLAIL